jgi:hypothetical protein
MEGVIFHDGMDGVIVKNRTSDLFEHPITFHGLLVYFIITCITDYTLLVF